MSDARLRELERRFHETGAIDDEAAYLLERLRLGGLDRARLELAAHLGQGAAARVAAIPPAQSPRALLQAIANVADPRITGRAACACAETLLAWLRRSGQHAGHGAAGEDALRAARAWFAEPSEPTRRECERLLVQPLAGLPDRQVHRQVVSAMTLTVMAEGPFGHRLSAPPFKPVDGGEPESDVEWLLVNAADACGFDALRTSLRGELVESLLR